MSNFALRSLKCWIEHLAATGLDRLTFAFRWPAECLLWWRKHPDGRRNELRVAGVAHRLGQRIGCIDGSGHSHDSERAWAMGHLWHGLRSEYFGKHALHLAGKMNGMLRDGARYRHGWWWTRMQPCIFTAESEQGIIPHKHRAGREHEESHREEHRDGWQADVEHFKQFFARKLN